MNVTEVERKESTKHCCGNGCLWMDSAEHKEEAEALIDQRITENNNTNADRQATHPCRFLRKLLLPVIKNSKTDYGPAPGAGPFFRLQDAKSLPE